MMSNAPTAHGLVTRRGMQAALASIAALPLPADLVAARSTLTGEHLAAYVGNHPHAVASR